MLGNRFELSGLALSGEAVLLREGHGTVRLQLVTDVTVISQALR